MVLDFPCFCKSEEVQGCPVEKGACSTSEQGSGRTTDKGKLEIKARDAEESVCADLTLACEDDVSFGIVTKRGC